MTALITRLSDRMLSRIVPNTTATAGSCSCWCGFGYCKPRLWCKHCYDCFSGGACVTCVYDSRC